MSLLRIPQASQHELRISSLRSKESPRSLGSMGERRPRAAFPPGHTLGSPAFGLASLQQTPYPAPLLPLTSISEGILSASRQPVILSGYPFVLSLPRHFPLYTFSQVSDQLVDTTPLRVLTGGQQPFDPAPTYFSRSWNTHFLFTPLAPSSELLEHSRILHLLTSLLLQFLTLPRFVGIKIHHPSPVQSYTL